jgi:uncharacterized protein (UPF0335 family)
MNWIAVAVCGLALVVAAGQMERRIERLEAEVAKLKRERE